MFLKASSGDSDTATALALTNRQANSIARKDVWRSPHLTSTAAARSFLTAIEADPHLTDLIESLRVEDRGLTRHGPYQSDLVEEEYRDEDVQKDLQIWTRLLDLIVRLSDQNAEQDGDRISKGVTSIAISSTAIVRFCGVPGIQDSTKPARKYNYKPTPIEKIKDAISVRNLTISGADYMAWRLYENLRVEEELTIYTCVHSLRAKLWQRIENGAASSLRIVHGPLIWNDDDARQFASDLFRVVMNRHYLEKPLSLVLVEIACIKTSDADDLRELLLAATNAIEPKISLRIDIRPWAFENVGSQVQVEQADWQSGRCLLPHDQLLSLPAPRPTLTGCAADSFDTCKSDPTYLYDAIEEGDEREEWVDVLPDKDEDEEEANDLRKEVSKNIDQTWERTVERRSQSEL